MTRRVPIRGQISKLLIGLCLVPVFFTWSAVGQETANDSAQANRDRLVVETLLRLEGYDLESNARAKSAVLRHLKRQQGKAEYVKLARHFQLKETVPGLVELALARADETVGAEAVSLVVKFDALKQMRLVVDGKHPERAASALQALGHVDDRSVRAYLKSLVSDSSRSRAVRNGAARSLGRTRLGERELLDLARGKKVLEDTRFAVGNILLASGDPGLRAEAGKYFKLPAGSNSIPLPPIAQLIKLS
ncbi:MAG: hypothetical protein VB877_10305, partial [Pirellulaceae bacterium]